MEKENSKESKLHHTNNIAMKSINFLYRQGSNLIFIIQQEETLVIQVTLIQH